jgi:HlyD family secretion protein
MSAPDTEAPIEAAPAPPARSPSRRGRAARWARRVAWVLVAALLVAAIAAAWVPKPLPVDAATARRGRLEVTVDEAARARVKDRFVVSAPLAGTLLRIGLRAGDPIEAGAPVARIVPPTPALLDARTRAEAEARVATAAAQQAQARAGATRAELARDRAEHEANDARRLEKTGALSEDQRERAELEARVRAEDVASARFAMQAADHEVGMARAALREVTGTPTGGGFEVTSPAKGAVLRVQSPNGGAIAAGTPLVEIGDPRALEVVCDVLTADAVRIRPGAKVALERWGGDPLAAHVRLVEPSAFTRLSALGVEEQRVSVVVDLDDPPAKWAALADGYRVEARIVVWEADDVVQVPSGAVFRRDGKWSAFAVRDGVAELRELTLGQRSGADVEVRAGLAAGEVVVVHPGDRVRAGARVAAR